MSGWPQLNDASAPTPVRSGSLAVWVTLPVPGSTRETLTVKFASLPPPLPIQSAPAPAAMSVGTPLASNLRVTALVSGSMRDTVLFSLFRNQTAPSPTAMLLGAVAASTNDAIFSPVAVDGGDAVADRHAVGLRAAARQRVIAGGRHRAEQHAARRRG